MWPGPGTWPLAESGGRNMVISLPMGPEPASLPGKKEIERESANAKVPRVKTSARVLSEAGAPNIGNPTPADPTQGMPGTRLRDGSLSVAPEPIVCSQPDIGRRLLLS